MKKLTILCGAMSEMGHMNAMIGVAIALKNAGHRVVFAIEKSWRGKIAKFGLEKAVFDGVEKGEDDAGKQWSEFLSQFEEKMSIAAPDERMRLVASLITEMKDAAEFSNKALKAIVENVKPNVVIEDYGFPLPTFVEAKVPVVKLYSFGLLIALNDKRLPPLGCGLPLTDSSDWEKYREKNQDLLLNEIAIVNEWFEEQCPDHPKLSSDTYYKSTNLNIYMYPKPLAEDYLKLCPIGDEWHCVDHCIRAPFGEFEVPEKLRKRPGKLIFLSLGSMGNSFVGLMRRLVNILSKSKNSFIVSRGYRSDEYQLAENMWGEAFVPQLAVLQQVDLVLTHGGNNSFTEALYFGKPMIVLPLFGDQYDNAQRAVEVNIGRRFDPFTVTEQELNGAIDDLLEDKSVAENVQRISKQIRESDAMERLVERIEFVAEHPKFPTFV